MVFWQNKCADGTRLNCGVRVTIYLIIQTVMKAGGGAAGINPIAQGKWDVAFLLRVEKKEVELPQINAVDPHYSQIPYLQICPIAKVYL